MPKAANKTREKIKAELAKKNEAKELDLPEGGVDIDGSIMEGGGQIIRIAMACSAIKGIPLRIRKIRAGRPRPGLAAQHLTGIRLVRDICQGKLEGDHVGSQCITFRPGKISDETEYLADAHTAGACTLVAQIAIPVLLFAGHNKPSTKLILRGGTNVAFAPTAEYLQHVFANNMKFFYDIDIKVKLNRRGWYPKGGGEIEIDVPRLQDPDSQLHGLNLDDAEGCMLTSFSVHVYTAGQFKEDASKMLWTASKLLKKGLRGLPITESHDHAEIDGTEVPNQGSGTPKGMRSQTSGKGILIKAEAENGFVFGSSYDCEKGKTDEETIEKAVNELLREVTAGVAADQWMQDQLIIFMALSKEESRLVYGHVTKHTWTAMSVVHSFIPDAEFGCATDDGGKTHVVRCRETEETRRYDELIKLYY